MAEVPFAFQIFLFQFFNLFLAHFVFSTYLSTSLSVVIPGIFVPVAAEDAVPFVLIIFMIQQLVLFSVRNAIAGTQSEFQIKDPRAQMRNLPWGAAARVHAAQENHLEGMMFFVAGASVMNYKHMNAELQRKLAALYLVFRLIHSTVFFLNIPVARSFVFIIGFHLVWMCMIAGSTYPGFLGIPLHWANYLFHDKEQKEKTKIEYIFSFGTHRFDFCCEICRWGNILCTNPSLSW